MKMPSGEWKMKGKEINKLINTLKEINDQLSLVAQNQRRLKRELQMIFSDITYFEHMVLKILDRKNGGFSREEYHN